jgi:hypothetical protein
MRVRPVQGTLNSTSGDLFNPAWADESATGLICSRCVYVYLFANLHIQLYKVPE